MSPKEMCVKVLVLDKVLLVDNGTIRRRWAKPVKVNIRAWSFSFSLLTSQPQWAQQVFSMCFDEEPYFKLKNNVSNWSCMEVINLWAKIITSISHIFLITDICHSDGNLIYTMPPFKKHKAEKWEGHDVFCVQTVLTISRFTL